MELNVDRKTATTLIRMKNQKNMKISAAGV